MVGRKRARSAIDVRPALLAAALAIPVWPFLDAAGAQSPPKQWRTPETAEDLAVLMLEQYDPADLMVSDWEFILSFRDASPANKAAADRVWKTIQDQQRNGGMKVKTAVTVIAAGLKTIEAAITEANARAGVADLRVVLDAPLKVEPPRGATIVVTGVLTGYNPEPFRFIMQNAQAPGLQ